MSKTPAERGRELFEKEDAEDREVAKKFDPKDILAKASKVRKVRDPVLGEIKYTVLTTGDLFEVNRIEDKEGKARAILFRMLRKAYPELKEDDINEFPMDVTTRLLQVLMSGENFFQIPQVSNAGSKSTSTPST
jgi:hypothetical protein